MSCFHLCSRTNLCCRAAFWRSSLFIPTFAPCFTVDLCSPALSFEAFTRILPVSFDGQVWLSAEFCNPQSVSLAFGLFVLFSCAKTSSSACFVGLQEIGGVAIHSNYMIMKARKDQTGGIKLTLFFCKAMIQGPYFLTQTERTCANV